MYVFYQYLVKEASYRRSSLCLSDGDEFTKEGSRRSPLCLSDGDKFTKEGFRRSPPVPNSQYNVARFHSCFMI